MEVCGVSGAGDKDKMGVPYVTSFCYCLGLEIAAKAIGYAHFLIALCFLTVCALFAEESRGYIGTVEDAEDQLYARAYKIAVVVTVVSTAHLVLAATLLYGVYKRNTTAIRVWIIVMSILFVTAIAFILTATIVWGFSDTGSHVFVSLLGALVFFGLLGYCILAVFSFYLLLRSSEDLDNPPKVDY